MEVVKKNGEVTQYRYYEWNGYTPLGMIVKKKDTTGNFQTKTYQFITNYRGDVLSIRDQDDQEIGYYSYDSYGNVLSVEGDVAKDNPIPYAGYYYDAETKNYYLQARYYNPENGAFLALAPHPGDDNEPLSQNGYSYARNNPNSIIDPNGEIWWLLWQGFYGAADNSYGYVWDVFKKSNYKLKKFKRNLNYKKLTTLAITGALTGMLGGALGRYLGKARVGVVNRLFVTFQWEFKSELAKQYSQDGEINVWRALYDAGKGTIQGEARALKLVYQAYIRGGKTRAIKVARRI